MRNVLAQCIHGIRLTGANDELNRLVHLTAPIATARAAERPGRYQLSLRLSLAFRTSILQIAHPFDEFIGRRQVLNL